MPFLKKNTGNCFVLQGTEILRCHSDYESNVSNIFSETY